VAAAAVTLNEIFASAAWSACQDGCFQRREL